MLRKRKNTWLWTFFDIAFLHGQNSAKGVPMELGDLVRVRLYGGEEVVRRFLVQRKRCIVVCSEEEFRRSLEECREADGIGFPAEDILGSIDSEEE